LSLNNSHNEYYETPEFWDVNLLDISEEKERVKHFIDALPLDVSTVIEVGCGNGVIINTLAEKKGNLTRVVGVDLSEYALKFVKVEKYKQNINNLEFLDNSFDCVIASEVLEHLTTSDFQIGLNEIQRISKKYILVSVPNEDDLELDIRMCNVCFCWFNPDYHMRSFNKSSLKGLFSKFRNIWIREIGYEKIKTEYLPLAKLFLHYNQKKNAKIGICPQCGMNYTLISKISDSFGDSQKQKSFYQKVSEIMVRKLFTKNYLKKRWLFALYERIM